MKSVLRVVGLGRMSVLACSVLALAACNPYVGKWLDADGQPVPDRSVQGEGLVVQTYVVTGHCDWGAATFLLIAWPPGRVEHGNVPSAISDGTARMYVRDPERIFAPEGVSPAGLAGDFEANAELPASAVATGLHREGWEIWTGQDEDSLYLVGPDRTERWQRAGHFITCM